MNSKRQTLVFIIHVRFMKDREVPGVGHCGEDLTMHQMRLCDQMNCEGPFGPQKAVPVRFLGRN